MKDILVEDHAEMDDLLRRVRSALDRKDPEAAFSLLDLLWARLAVHIRAENTLLFPALERAHDRLSIARRPEARHGPAHPPAPLIAELREDHDFFMRELTRAVLALKQLCRTSSCAEAERVCDQVRRTLAAVEERLRRHNEREESGVYQLAHQWLDTAQMEKLRRRIADDLRRMPSRWTSGNPPSR